MQTKISLKWSLIILGIVAIAFSPEIILFLVIKSSTMPPSQPAVKSSSSYRTNIIRDAAANEYFRHVLFTGKQSQLVVMNIPPGGEIGKETHKYTEQTIFFLSGTAEGVLDGNLFPVGPGDVVVVLPGTEQNFRNTGTVDLKIYKVNTPPNHIDGRVHRIKAESDADTADKVFGDSPPLQCQQ